MSRAEQHTHEMEHSHDVEHEHEREGLLPAQWILRSMVIGVVGLLTLSIVTSIGDIRRYMHIKRL